jgi:hypothetical protein
VLGHGHDESVSYSLLETSNEFEKFETSGDTTPVVLCLIK